jgi:hypothetical protein
MRPNAPEPLLPSRVPKLRRREGRKGRKEVKQGRKEVKEVWWWELYRMRRGEGVQNEEREDAKGKRNRRTVIRTGREGRTEGRAEKEKKGREGKTKGMHVTSKAERGGREDRKPPQCGPCLLGWPRCE